MASSTAAAFSTGSAPGSPRQTGQTLLLGCAPKLVGQPQKILVAVASWTCTSSPITGSYLAISAGPARSTNACPMPGLVPGSDFVDVNIVQHAAGGNGHDAGRRPSADLVVVGDHAGAGLEVFLQIWAQALVGTGEQI